MGALYHGRFGGPKWLIPVSNALPPMERNRRLLLDRYESHTKNCKVPTSLPLGHFRFVTVTMTMGEGYAQARRTLAHVD